MRKVIYGILIISFGLLLSNIVYQIYWMKNAKGNLIVYFGNLSENDSIKLDVYADNEEVIVDMINKMHINQFNHYPLSLSPKNHIVRIVINNKYERQVKVNLFLNTILFVEYYGQRRAFEESGDLSFIIETKKITLFDYLFN